MGNPFRKVSDDEFLRQVSSYMGKVNFVRLVNAVFHVSTLKEKCSEDKDYGNWLYEYINENNKG